MCKHAQGSPCLGIMWPPQGHAEINASTATAHRVAYASNPSVSPGTTRGLMPGGTLGLILGRARGLVPGGSTRGLTVDRCESSAPLPPLPLLSNNSLPKYSTPKWCFVTARNDTAISPRAGFAETRAVLGTGMRAPPGKRLVKSSIAGKKLGARSDSDLVLVYGTAEIMFLQSLRGRQMLMSYVRTARDHVSLCSSVAQTVRFESLAVSQSLQVYVCSLGIIMHTGRQYTTCDTGRADTPEDEVSLDAKLLQHPRRCDGAVDAAVVAVLCAVSVFRLRIHFVPMSKELA